MKTKYIKVATSDRLPDKFGITGVIDTKGIIKTTEFLITTNEEIFRVKYDYWLKEVPDHEEEMREMLEELLKTFNSCVGYGHPVSDRVKELLTKINEQS